MPPINKPSVLIFSAHDPSCGAGMPADILTISDIGVQSLAVLTAVTAQDSKGVHRCEALSADLVFAQAEVLLADLLVAPVVCKIGVLGSPENIFVIGKLLRKYPEMLVVVDPVLSSGRGDSFANQAMIRCLIEQILPITTLLTPNSLEAAKLSYYLDHSITEQKLMPMDDFTEVNTQQQLSHAAQILKSGCANVLITGGHLASQQVINRLYQLDSQQQGQLVSELSWQRLAGQFHGSGCRLAAAIAAYLALGLSLNEALQLGQSHTFQALLRSAKFGQGQFIPQIN